MLTVLIVFLYLLSGGLGIYMIFIINNMISIRDELYKINITDEYNSKKEILDREYLKVHKLVGIQLIAMFIISIFSL